MNWKIIIWAIIAFLVFGPIVLSLFFPLIADIFGFISFFICAYLIYLALTKNNKDNLDD